MHIKSATTWAQRSIPCRIWKIIGWPTRTVFS